MYMEKFGVGFVFYTLTWVLFTLRNKVPGSEGVAEKIIHPFIEDVGSFK